MKFLFFIILSMSIFIQAETIYVSPNGSGDGSSANSPLGSFAQAIAQLDAGDTMILLDGIYDETLSLTNLKGTASQRITIKAENMSRAHIDGKATLTHAVYMDKCQYVDIDGLVAGHTKHTAWNINNSSHVTLTRCAGYDAGYLVAQDGNVENKYSDNCHVFGIAYSDHILAEDVWGWGTGRYVFMYFQCTNCTVRRGVFRPTNPELGYGYDRCPHAGFNLYDCDNCLAENCIAFETRVHTESNHAAGNVWGLVQGGMVFDDHTLPSGYNKVLGCFDLDNGQERSEVARSNPAVHLMSKWSGMFEDVVIWRNALGYGFVKGTSGQVDLPTRALIGSPTKLRQNTAVTYNMNHRYVDGELTDQPLWPWPYDEHIKSLMQMDETMTEYVTRMVKSHLDIKVGADVVEHAHNPFSLQLGKNYPNPFNPSTTIPFSLNSAEHVNIDIYNAVGIKIKTLVDDSRAAGEHRITWDGQNDHNEHVTSGLYFIRMTTENSSFVQKALLVR